MNSKGLKGIENDKYIDFNNNRAGAGLVLV
jgi:hypothetical protein